MEAKKLSKMLCELCNKQFSDYPCEPSECYLLTAIEDAVPVDEIIFHYIKIDVNGVPEIKLQFGDRVLVLHTDPVDAVEVVRCKDCKHWQPIHEHIPHMECQIFCGAYGKGYPTNADDFCSYGTKK